MSCPARPWLSWAVTTSFRASPPACPQVSSTSSRSGTCTPPRPIDSPPSPKTSTSPFDSGRSAVITISRASRSTRERSTSRFSGATISTVIRSGISPTLPSAALSETLPWQSWLPRGRPSSGITTGTPGEIDPDHW